MLKLYDAIYNAISLDEAITRASKYTEFSKDQFKCEVIKEPIKKGLFKKELGSFHCWYEYENFDLSKELHIADAALYFDNNRKKILVLRAGYKMYEIGYSTLKDYEMVVVSKTKTYTISNSNKALKGALLFGTTGAVVGASKSNIESETVERAEIIIRLVFTDKEPFEILTCNSAYETDDKEWRAVLDQAKIIDEYFKELIGIKSQTSY
ncbi:hypothetical protein [Anaerotignum sp.]|uniref:hypothetical protein n=1 Tax=Anaerotignum sp. TaxID=2039241 RepID=UPI00289DDB7C|nr:hypothetical protein [Anaerotignum sp.]